ncbi:MAG TPA: hypothetical protein VED01_24390 [Burkholderiales bacterium]|nr:hypothetical protein [Burkholderiales bacterium]
MEQLLGSSSQDVLETPVRGGPRISSADRQSIDLSRTIPGWGSDLDRQARPGVPRDKAPEIGSELLYPPIEQQPPRVKIHKSTEHARMTPVFGTACPPQGLSGMLRDAAYHFSEGRLARWLTLMLADRVNVVEGIVGDLAHGHVPNLVKETGLRSELRYNRANFMKKVAVAGVAVGLVILYARSRRS